MARMFGTDGVRGVAGAELTSELAYALGQAGAVVLRRNGHSPRILIGRDTRISGCMLESALAAGVCSVGGTAVIAGVVPTPAVAYLTRTGGFDAGAVISASHNSFEFNGIKFFDADGYKLPDATEDEIEKLVRSDDVANGTGRGIGTREEFAGAAEKYIDFACSTLKDVDLSGMKIVVDCANGASGAVAPEALRRMGAEVTVLHAEPDGCNINDQCGSTHMDSLVERVKQTPGAIGIAFDGDADRMLAVDEDGNIVDGDVIMTVCALDMRKRGALTSDTVVVTIMSNMGMDIAARREGLRLVKTAVGDRYVLEKMRADGYNFGGEQSGHMIFLDHNTTGDGLVSALQLCGVIRRSGKSLRELSRVMHVLPQVLVNARIDSEKRRIYAEDPVVAEEIRRLEKKYDGAGRVLIRLSGTEPLVRVMLEGEDLADMKRDAQALADLMCERLV